MAGTRRLSSFYHLSNVQIANSNCLFTRNIDHWGWKVFQGRASVTLHRKTLGRGDIGAFDTCTGTAKPDWIALPGCILFVCSAFRREYWISNWMDSTSKVAFQFKTISHFPQFYIFWEFLNSHFAVQARKGETCPVEQVHGSLVLQTIIRPFYFTFLVLILIFLPSVTSNNRLDPLPVTKVVPTSIKIKKYCVIIMKKR